MRFTEQRFDNALLFKVSGRIDRDTADEFMTTLQPHLDREVGFDVANFAGVIPCHDSVEQALAVMSHSAHAAYTQSK
jgi:hypothetical protein